MRYFNQRGGLNMISKLKENWKSDKADSLVTALFVLPTIAVLAMSGVDLHVNGANNTIVSGIARDGAKTVSNFGVNPSSLSALPSAYGAADSTISQSCKDLKSSVFADMKIQTDSYVECAVANQLAKADGNGLIKVKVESVECGPDSTAAIGQTTYCNIEWKTTPFPLSFRSINDAMSLSESGDELMQESCGVASAEFVTSKTSREIGYDKLCGGSEKP